MAIDDTNHLARMSAFARASSRYSNRIVLMLLIVGGVSWGPVGLFAFDPVGPMFGLMTPATWVCCALVWLVALFGVSLAIRQAAGRSGAALKRMPTCAP